MSFKELSLKKEYYSLSDNIVSEFYAPIFKEAVLYKRAVGFFSSSALARIIDGIGNLIGNNGKIQLIASPHLSLEDVNSINEGYDKRGIIHDALINELKPCEEEKLIDKLNALAYLIANEYMDIRIAFVKNNTVGIFHEKMGLMYDVDGNIIAFSGSMNESETAFIKNYEAIDVFESWTSDFDRVLNKENNFDATWNNNEIGIETFDFPDVKETIVKNYLREDRPLPFNNGVIKEKTNNYKARPKKGEPFIPDFIQLYDYQIEAIKKWEENDYCGIFDMATGTGKTFTALAAITRLLSNTNKELSVFIVCPFQHLVEQWVEDMKLFNINPVIGYSASHQKNWKNQLKDQIFRQNLAIQTRKKKFFCFISTNMTFASDYVQEQIKTIKGPILLVIDEAHNFGAKTLITTLTDRFTYRLALTATLDRHFDEQGTQDLINYFGTKCIEYDLHRAIKEKKLTPYYYKPVLVYLTDEERREYREYSRQIAKETRRLKNGKFKLSEKGKFLALQRSRIVAGANGKLDKLIEIITPYKNDSHMLVYCGTAKIEDEDNLEEKRQIDVITKHLGVDLEMRVSQFTSREDINERTLLKKDFVEGNNLQALVAIKCLDEGVNIPSIKTAFILASTTNPKEYIQRRGRVLRLAKGKEYAMIYDFITLPRPIDETAYQSEEEMKLEVALVKNEIRRCIEFKKSAINPIDSDELIYETIEAYHGALGEEFMEELYGEEFSY
ncbi:MAG: DEAD/DEAH box helicase family protein [Eubacteriaceae bacterium]|nr:DEAD/DEAH box helicase family protein [Eubacteriaceae bacterium]